MKPEPFPNRTFPVGEGGHMDLCTQASRSYVLVVETVGCRVQGLGFVIRRLRVSMWGSWDFGWNRVIRVVLDLP